jgi:hypothetical protein
MSDIVKIDLINDDRGRNLAAPIKASVCTRRQ